MRCSRTENLLSAYVDGELSDSRRDRVEAHLGACAGCRAQLVSLRELSTKVRDLEREDDELSTTWETTLAARLAMVDAEIEAEETAAANRGVRVMPQVLTSAALLLMGLTLGLVGSRLLPATGAAAPGDGDLTRVDPMDGTDTLASTGRPTAAPTTADMYDPDVSQEDWDQYITHASKLGALAEDAYVVLTDAKVPDYLPGDSDDEKLHFFESEIELVQLGKRSKDALVSLANGPNELLGDTTHREFTRLATDLVALCSQLRNGTTDARSRLLLAREESKDLLACSARAASLVPGRPSWRRKDLGQDGLPALATQVRYDALSRRSSVFKSRLNTLAKRLGEDHPYVHHHRSFWAPIAALRSGSSSEPLKVWLECNPELEQSDVIFIIQTGAQGDRTRTMNFQIRAELDPETREQVGRHLRQFRQLLRMTDRHQIVIPDAESLEVEREEDR